MRKIVLLYMLLLCSGLALAQVRCYVSYSACIDGIYGAWSQTYTDFYYGRFSEVYQIGEYRHPSEYSWKLTLHDFVRPDEKQIKEHYRKKEAWEYSGTLEYYVSDAYPTSLSQLKAFGYLAVAPWNHVVSKGQTPCVKRIQKVSVTILPYKDFPHCYNVFYHDVDNNEFNQGFAVHFITNPLNW